MKDKRRNRGSGSSLPQVVAKKCTGCGTCAKVCFRKAISFGEDDKVSLFKRRCVGMESCGRCVTVCGHDAITAGGN